VTTDELCPGCGENGGIHWVGSTEDTDSWACECGTEWVIDVAVPVSVRN
jgi:hypothetical protein